MEAYTRRTRTGPYCNGETFPGINHHYFVAFEHPRVRWQSTLLRLCCACTAVYDEKNIRRHNNNDNNNNTMRYIPPGAQVPFADSGKIYNTIPRVPAPVINYQL